MWLNLCWYDLGGSPKLATPDGDSKQNIQHVSYEAGAPTAYGLGGILLYESPRGTSIAVSPPWDVTYVIVYANAMHNLLVVFFFFF